ncbi:MAG: trigger factor [Ignavibacteria bacterium]
METKINVISQIEQELEVTLEYNEIIPEIEQVYKDEARKIEMSGFRKGKVPMSLIKKMYGKTIDIQASEDIANEKFWDIAEKQGLHPVSTPKIVDIDFKKGESLSFKIRYEVVPEIDIKNYTGQEVEKIVYMVDDELVNDDIDYFCRENSITEDAEVVEDKNYIITVDIQKLDENGEPDKNIRSQMFEVDLSENKINSMFFDNAIGKKTGESFNFEFQDDREIEEDGVSKFINVTLKHTALIKGIKKIVLPELNEEFVKKITKNKFSTLDEWKESIRQELKKYYDTQSEEMLVNSLISMVIKNNEFKVPHGYIHAMLDKIVAREEEKFERNSKTKFDAYEARKKFYLIAEMSSKWQILSELLVKKENIMVSDEELKEIAEKESAEIGISVEKLLKYYAESNKSGLLLDRKIGEFLINNNNIKEVSDKDIINNIKEVSDKDIINNIETISEDIEE